MDDKQPQPFLLLDRVCSVPSMELRLRDDGQVEYRYRASQGASLRRYLDAIRGRQVKRCVKRQVE